MPPKKEPTHIVLPPVCRSHEAVVRMVSYRPKQEEVKPKKPAARFLVADEIGTSKVRFDAPFPAPAPAPVAVPPVIVAPVVVAAPVVVEPIAAPVVPAAPIVPAAATTAPTLAPELRAWLKLQARILAYWDSLPDSQFKPAIPAATRTRDRKILAGLKVLLADTE